MNSDRWKGARNAMVLLIGLLAAWQALYWFAGEAALRSPLETFRYTGKLVTSEGFWPHLSETMRAFVGSSRVDLQACKLEYSIVSPK